MKQKLLYSIKLRVCMLVAVMCAAFAGQAWATDFSETYGYSDEGSTWEGTNFTDESSYWKSVSGSNCTAVVSGIFTGKTITSDVKITLDVATYGSGTNPSSSKFSIYTSDMATQVTATQSGTLPSSSSYVNTVYTVSKANALANFTDGLAIKIASGTKLIRFRSFKIEFSYVTISPVSNNGSYGTVSLSGTTITATPKSGYRVVSGDGGYTVTAGTADVTNNGDNTFTVTPTTDCTIQINFEAIPSHSITGVSDPAAGGSVDVASSLHEGGSTTVTAYANPGYKFTGWDVSGTGATLSSNSTNPTTLTMGTADATVTASFEEVTTHQIKWSVNGTIVKTENVEENAALDFSAPASGVPTGYTFKGWVVAANRIDGTTDTDPKANYVTSGTSTEDIIYYAVMAVESGSAYTAHLTGDEIASNFSSSAMSYSDSENTYSDTGDGVTWGARCITAKDNHRIQLKSDKNVYIKIAAAAAITEVKVKISNASNTSGGSDDITKHGAFSGNVYLDNEQDTNTGTYGSASSSAIVDNILTITPTKSSSTLYIHVSAGARIWNVDVTYSNLISSHFCTTVGDYPVTISDAGYTTYVTPDDVTMHSGVKAYIATTVNTNTIHIEEVENVPANEPIILKASAGTYYLPVITSSTDDVSANILQASTGSTTGNGSSIFALGVGKVAPYEGVVGFYLVKKDQTVPAGKAYLEVTAPGVKGFTFDFDGVATGVNAIAKGQEATANGQIFNLAGQRVNKAQKGLYIMNGKKVLVK